MNNQVRARFPCVAGLTDLVFCMLAVADMAKDGLRFENVPHHVISSHHPQEKRMHHK
jgi:hypothetical protein